ncbi:endoplasmic reticulum metallopeptidase 1 isoform X2 [Rhinatrema bivittatum]|uniref:endoplasmic reticulum metallopeptidase 1 isoform X2 n=1 Tax=Rhinatrema bivittatum TaxID=194408 RepID=UPI00112BE2C9|nr:endoplasmic reticulum metallopeptidase 1 isoform X2 [Rhinatrema bivittatum]
MSHTPPRDRELTRPLPLSLSPHLLWGEGMESGTRFRGVGGWERSERREEEEEKRRRHGAGGTPAPRALLREALAVPLMLLFVLGLRALVQLSLRQLLLPGALPASAFSAAAAREYLEHVTSIGSRPVGSPANEVLTVNYLLEQIKRIEAASSKVHRLSVDVQRPTGTFSLDFLGGFTSYYDNITNIAVKLEPRGGAQHAVLSNCHFDSVVNTPGASDDAVSCAVMLEVLNALSRSSETLQHAIIFLFNGAEENILQASHGFITQHPWAKLVRAFINLEAAGVGGKELVFQTGPENPWLVQAYVSAAVHPFASVVAQEVFQSGVIPSDTDFRIYRDFGNIPGIDLAFIENGYIYHTKYDTSDRILTDSIQRAGDNILGILKYLATSDKLANPSEYRHGNMVFFDICGLFVFAYPIHVGTVMNYIVAAGAILYLGRKVAQSKYGGISYMKNLLYGVGITLLSWFATLFMVLVVAVFVSLTGYSLSWYTHFYVAICLYGSAALTKLIFVHRLAKRWVFVNANAHYLGELFFDVALIVWCFGVVVLTHKGLCSAYVMTMWVAFPLLTKLATHREFTLKGATLRFVLMYLLGMFVPFLHTLYLVWAVFEMFTPIMGRSGTEIPPDAVLASLIVGCTIFLSTFFISFIYLTKSMRKSLLLLASLSAVTLILVCSGTFFPYSSDSASPKPKRIFLQHITRTFHGLDGNIFKRDSGIWINAFDYTGISHITPHIPEINDSVQAPCEDVPFCGFPWFLPVQFLIRKNWYLPTPEASPSKPTHFRLLSKEQMPWHSTRLTFEIAGPSHMSLYVRAHEGALLSGWSLGDGAPVADFKGDHFVFYSHGLQAPPWKFWLELKSYMKRNVL